MSIKMVNQCPASEDGRHCAHGIGASVGVEYDSYTQACCYCGEERVITFKKTEVVILDRPKHGTALLSYGILP